MKDQGPVQGRKREGNAQEMLPARVGNPKSFPMTFVGRERELKQIQQAMEREKNLILVGKYGIGRTRLVKHFAHRQESKRWRFIFTDFSKTPLGLCQQMMIGLGLEGSGSIRKTHLSYSALRFRIAHGNLPQGPRPVLVFDNMAKLTPPKLNLIRDLAWTGQFRFIAIVEDFIPPKDLFRLRALLRPASLLPISFLPRACAQEFFRTAARQRSLRWTESEIAHLAAITGGYPLRMKEVLIGKLMNNAPSGRNSSSPMESYRGNAPSDETGRTF